MVKYNYIICIKHVLLFNNDNKHINIASPIRTVTLP